MGPVACSAGRCGGGVWVPTDPADSTPDALQAKMGTQIMGHTLVLNLCSVPRCCIAGFVPRQVLSRNYLDIADELLDGMSLGLASAGSQIKLVQIFCQISVGCF